MTWDIAIQLLATAMLLYGLHAMGDMKRRGPLLASLSELLWVMVGVLHSVWGLILLSIILAIMQGRNFIKWHKENVPW